MDFEPRIVGPAQGFQHTHTIIFLHGKGSNSVEFASEFFESEASQNLVPKGPRTFEALFPSVRWVFPSAPLMRSGRFDCVEPQWFDMWAVENPDERFESQVEGLKQSISLLGAVVSNEETILPRERILLAGISQGFATVVAAALLAPMPFAGLIGLCTWMPEEAYDNIRAARGLGTTTATLSNTPVFLGHSKNDGIVPVENGRALREYLLQYQAVIDWHEYISAEHWIVEPEGVDDMVTFLRSHIKP